LFGSNAGIAAATLGATQYILGAIVSAIAALLSKNTLWPVILVIILSSVIAIFGARYSSKR